MRYVVEDTIYLVVVLKYLVNWLVGWLVNEGGLDPDDSIILRLINCGVND